VDTRQQILDVASELAQRFGFSAFSYADISEKIGIRKASIHHHFASKEALELALVEDYRAQFSIALQQILAEATDAKLRLRRYAALYQRALSAGRMCLCGMMASDLQALPASLKVPLQGFFTDQIAWLAMVLKHGKAETKAEAILVSLQGALLIARLNQDERLISRVIEQQLATLQQ
jgi:TetR/AcrR family transcriptional regulator, transcriptional repressor for nem operon